METIHSADEIATRVAELGRQIRTDAGNETITLIGILKGTTVFLADLIRQIEEPVNYELMNVVRSVADTKTAEALQINFITNFFLEGRKMILLKDVVSTGVIETYLLNQLRQKSGAEIKLAALLDRPEMRTVPLEVDYAAFSVAPGSYVGYGLELDNRYSNYRDIRRL
ncbi:MAG: hypoxanthine phosphoribosyltransferase [Acidobacteria bacterium]|nr:hypoxanthine phosphoribosyltransferase [Acidobacteriota bacterium]